LATTHKQHIVKQMCFTNFRWWETYLCRWNYGCLILSHPLLYTIKLITQENNIIYTLLKIQTSTLDSSTYSLKISMLN